jgi:hypothetical protein
MVAIGRYQPSKELKEGRYKSFSVNHEEGSFSNEELAKLGQFNELLGFRIPPQA